MKLRHGLVNPNQYQSGVRFNLPTKTNALTVHAGSFAFCVPLLASLSFAGLMFGCAKNTEPVKYSSSVPVQQPVQQSAQHSAQQPVQQSAPQSEIPNKPPANQFPNLQDPGPFMEPICQAPEKENSSLFSTPIQQNPKPQTKQNQPAPASQSQALQNYPAALASLRDGGFVGAADALEARVNQKSRKMKLTGGKATKIAGYLLENLPKLPNSNELERILPKSVVELMVAVEERGVSQEEAEKISDFLIRFTGAMRFQNPGQFDSNLSHVIGRDWSQIDYSGEGTSWQQRKRQWAKFGVASFKTAESIENYFTREKELGYFNKIYQPEGQWP